MSQRFHTYFSNALCWSTQAENIPVKTITLFDTRYKSSLSVNFDSFIDSGKVVSVLLNKQFNFDYAWCTILIKSGYI